MLLNSVDSIKIPGDANTQMKIHVMLSLVMSSIHLGTLAMMPPAVIDSSFGVCFEELFFHLSQAAMDLSPTSSLRTAAPPGRVPRAQGMMGGLTSSTRCVVPCPVRCRSGVKATTLGALLRVPGSLQEPFQRMLSFASPPIQIFGNSLLNAFERSRRRRRDRSTSTRAAQGSRMAG